MFLICFFIYNIGTMVYEMNEKKKEQEFLKEELVKVELEESVTEQQLEKLRDPDYVARYARQKYLYSKDGEFIIKIP